MRFDTLVTGVLKEYNTPTTPITNIPVLDGAREVWIMRVTDSLNVRELFRISQYTRWDGCAGSCTIPSYQQTKDIATRHFIEQCKTIGESPENINNGVNRLNQELSKIENVIGTYKIIDNWGHPLSWESESYIIGVEVYLHAYKASTHAAEELADF
jgi:hypothetical protein